MEIWRHFRHCSTYEPAGFENAARYLNFETNLLKSGDRPMSSQSLVKFGPRTPENGSKKCPTSKYAKWSTITPIAVKFGTMMRHRTAEVAKLIKFTSGRNQNYPLHSIRCEIRISVSTPLTLIRLHFETQRVARYLNSERKTASIDDRCMSSQV